jgi:hypothetical protein
MNNLIQQIAPTFLAGCKQLHSVLSPVVMLAMFAGLLILCVQAMQEKHLARFWPYFMRMAIAVILLGSLATWGDLVQSSVTDVLSQTAFGSGPLPVAQAYEQALAAKFGTNSVATTGQTIQSNGGVPIAEGDTSGGYAQPGSSTKITDYAFANDLTPDSNSSNGIGNHGNQLTAFTGTGTSSAALTASAAQLYNVQIGQQFMVQAANGSTYSLTYDDTVPSTYNGVSTGDVIDIYDPNGLLGGNNFSSTATSVTDGTMTTPVSNGQINMPTFSMNPATWASTLAWIFCYFLSLIALALMAIMTIVQNVAYMLMVAASPIFIAFLCIPALAHISTRFFLSLFAICLWPVGWVLADLVTKLILTAVVASTNTGNVLANAVGSGFGFGGWILLALWVIISSVLAPLVVSKAIVGGGTGIAQVLMGAGGAASFLAFRGAPGVASAVMGGGSISAQSNAMMNPPPPRLARRPISSRAEQES